MQIFNLAFSKRLFEIDIDISLNIASRSYCNILEFKLALPGCDTTSFSDVTVSAFMLYPIKQRYFFLRHAVVK